MGIEPRSEDNHCRHFISQPLSPAIGFLESGGYHLTVGYDGREAFIHHLHRNIGKFLLQSSQERADIFHALGRLAIDLLRFADEARV